MKNKKSKNDKDDLKLSKKCTNRMEISGYKEKKSKNTLKEALRQAYDELEKRVEERTADLIQINKRLQDEIIERTKAEESLHYQIEFEKLITTLSADFIKLSPDEVPSAIKKALQMVGKFVGIDCIYVILLSDDCHMITDIYEWSIGDTKSKFNDLKGCVLKDIFPWLAKKIINQRVFNVSSFDELPLESHLERKYFQGHGIQSFIIVPMFFGKSFIGYLGFNSRHARKTWEVNIIALLRIVGEIFANALGRKRIEDECVISESKYQLLFEYSSDGIVLLDSNGNILDCNSAYMKFLGLSSEEIIGKHAATFFTDESKKHFQQQFRIIEEEGKSESEFEIVQKNGKILPLWFNAKAICDDFDKFVGALVHFVDITCWKPNGQMIDDFHKNNIDVFKNRFQEIIGEKSLSDDVKKFAYSELEQIFNSSADGMGIIDKNFNLIQINNTFLKMLDIDKHETIRKKCYEVFPSSLCHKDSCPLTRILKGEDYIKGGIEIEPRNGYAIPCLLTASPFWSPNGTLIGILESFRCISNVENREDVIQKQTYIKEKVFDISIDGFYVSDAEGKIVDANPAFTNLVGYSREELSGMKIGDLEIIENTRDKKDNQTKERVAMYETSLRHKNGNIVRVEISSSLIYHKWERFLISSARDITEHKHRERQIRFLSFALEHSINGIALVDLNGNLLSVNNAFAAIHGYNPEELIGKHVSIFYPYPLKDYLAISNYKINAVEEFNGEVWHMRRDGTVFPAEIYNSFLRDNEGCPVGNVMIIKEITKEKRIEKSIIKGEDTDRLLLNAYTDSAFLIDTDGTILGLNEKAAKDFDTYSDELIGTCLYDLLPPKRESACKDLVGKVVHSNKPVHFSEGLVGKGIDENYCPILDEHGKVVKVAIFCRGITRTVKETFRAEEKEKIITLAEGPGVKTDIEGKKTLQDFLKAGHIHKNHECSFCFENIISRSPKVWDLFEIIPAIAESVSTVLIQGESGTGKRLFARAIHNQSARRDKPFITVNCGAIPDTLLESELFGYKAGAFTDAKKDKPGRFALADGGTLFLDEIGDISLAMQVRLLRFLQERVYEPLGSLESIKADVRIITATNKNLENLVRDGNFREDLFYRINVVRLDLPPLRERMEDVPLLIEHFIARYNKQYGKEINGISDEALTILLSYDYPGNVRELENIIERTIVLCLSGKIRPNHLPKKLHVSFDIDNFSKSTLTQIQKVEAAFLMNMLKQNDWSRQKTARQLGIHKTTLFRKIRTLGLKIPKTIKQSDS